MKENNEHSEFDDLIKEKFSTSFQQTDDLMWKRLNDQLIHNDSQRKRRIVFFWSLNIIVVLLLTGLGFYLARPQQNKEEVYTSSSATKKNTELKESKSENITHNSNRENTLSDKATKEFIDSPSHQEPTLNNDALDNQDKKKKLNKILAKQNPKAQPQDHFTPTLQKNKANFSVPESYNKVTNTKEIVEKTNVTEIIPLEQKVLETTEGKTDIAKTDLSQSSTDTSLTIEQSSVEEKVTATGLEKTKPEDLAPIISPVSLSGKWYIGALLNPSFSNNSVNDHAGNTGLSAAHYKANEKGDWNWNYGISAGYAVNNVFGIRSGLKVSSYSSTYSASSLTMQYDTSENNLNFETSYGEDDFNESEFIGDEADEPEPEEFNEDDTTSLVLSFSNLHTMRFIHIPIEVEFGIQLNKWRLYSIAGVAYGRLISNHTEFVTPGYKPIERNDSDFLNRNSLNATLELGIEYSLYKQFAVQLAPQLIYSISKVNKSNEISTHPYWLGFNLGLKYYL